VKKKLVKSQRLLQSCLISDSINILIAGIVGGMGLVNFTHLNLVFFNLTLLPFLFSLFLHAFYLPTAYEKKELVRPHLLGISGDLIFVMLTFWVKATGIFVAGLLISSIWTLLKGQKVLHSQTKTTPLALLYLVTIVTICLGILTPISYNIAAPLIDHPQKLAGLAFPWQSFPDHLPTASPPATNRQKQPTSRSTKTLPAQKKRQLASLAKRSPVVATNPNQPESAPPVTKTAVGTTQAIEHITYTINNVYWTTQRNTALPPTPNVMVVTYTVQNHSDTEYNPTNDLTVYNATNQKLPVYALNADIGETVAPGRTMQVQKAFSTPIRQGHFEFSCKPAISTNPQTVVFQADY